MGFLKPSDKENFCLEDPDVQLMLDFQAGDKSAFDKLLTKYFKRVLNFTYRYVGSKESAEDLAQEVFIRVYNTASRYKPASKFQTFIFTIAKNLALNEVRRAKHVAFSIDERNETQSNKAAFQVEDSSAEAPSENILNQEKGEIVRAAIYALPENQRTAVLLRRYENFRYVEIGATMGISEKAVKSLLNRAKENLKEQLKKYINI